MAPPTTTTLATPRSSSSVPPAGDDTTSSAPPESATSTTVANVTVELVLDPIERLAARDGVTIAVSVDEMQLGGLSDAEPRLVVTSPLGSSAEFRYVAADGTPTGLAWSQTVTPGEAVVVQPWRSGSTTNPVIVLAWQIGRDAADYSGQLDRAAAVNVLSPLTWSVSVEGEIVGGLDAELVAAVQERGLQVWPAVQGLDADALHFLVSSPQARRAGAARIAADAATAGADGVNIDLEGFRNEDAAGVTAFVTDVADAVHEWGGVVSYDLVPRTDDWDVMPPELSFWSTAPERREIAAVVDYTVLMAYDQHNRHRPAGPVASPEWVEEAVRHMLRYADPDTIILGVPAYGRLWDQAALDAPRALSLGFFDGLSGERTFDEEFGLDRIDLPDGTFFWVDNEVEQQRIDLAHRYGLAGWAVWRLGLDDAGLWDRFGSGG